MKRHLIISVLSAFLLFSVESSFGQISVGFTLPQSSSGYSPTTPGSTYQNNLVPNQSNFFSYDQNLAVTGNVPGGRHFRGFLPYSSTSTTGIGTNFGSISPVDSFIRRSAGTPYQSSARVEPFYLPRRTVSSVMRGNVSGLALPEVTFPGGTGKFEIKKQLAPISANTSGIYRPRSTLSMSASELERLSGRGDFLEAFKLPGDNFTSNRIIAPEDSEVPVRPGLESVLDELRENMLDDSREPIRPLEPEVPLDQQTKELMKLLEEERLARDDIQEMISQELPAGDEEAIEKDELEKPEDELPESKYKPKLPERREFPKVEPGEAKAILGEHKTFESLGRAKFAEFMAEGDSLLKSGRFYKAIDTFKLASIWDSGNPEAYIHRAIAHYAAGEYVSASLFVLTAIELSGDYAKRKIDIGDLTDDKDIVENRLIEAADWRDRDVSGEIAFVLAYVYYQQGRIVDAKECITIAAQQMKPNKAVVLLKEAIDSY